MAFALLHLDLTSRFRWETLPIGSLLLQPSGGTHPQRHSILEVLRRPESVRWFLSRCGQSCSSRKQWLDLFPLDTVNVPYGGSVAVILDFADPFIRGMSGNFIAIS